MIVHDCEQGSQEWLELRLGIPTASRFDAIITPARLEPTKGKARLSYIAELLAEWMLAAPLDESSNAFMERGKDMERAAVRWYQAEHGVKARAVGFVTTDDGKLGCSPDRLIGDDGGLEIKCPSAKVHASYLIDPSSLFNEYKLQVFGCLLITGREWWDLMSYHPVMPKVVKRVTLDHHVRAVLEPALTEFVADLETERAYVRALGGFANMANPFGVGTNE